MWLMAGGLASLPPTGCQRVTTLVFYVTNITACHFCRGLSVTKVDSGLRLEAPPWAVNARMGVPGGHLGA